MVFDKVFIIVQQVANKHSHLVVPAASPVVIAIIQANTNWMINLFHKNFTKATFANK